MKEDKLHPVHKLKQDEATRLANKLCDELKGHENIKMVVAMIYDLKLSATTDGMYQGIDIINHDAYMNHLNKIQERDKEKEQDECECNHLSEEEMSRCLEYNECYDKFECPKCDKLH